MGSPRACFLYPTALCEDQRPDVKSLSLSTEVREGASADEPSLTSVTIPPSGQITKPPCSGQGHQHLPLLPHTLEGQSGTPFFPCPSQSHALPPARAPHSRIATPRHRHCYHVPELCQHDTRPPLGGHGATAPQNGKTRDEAADVAMRLSPGSPLPSCAPTGEPLTLSGPKLRHL